MKYASLKGIDKKASKLIYGTGNHLIMGEDIKSAFECLDNAYENGFTVFDTAHAYEYAEHNLGNWIKDRDIRKEIIILDKGCNPGLKGSGDELSAECLKIQVDESLRRLKTDYLDIYILHRDDKKVSPVEILETLNDYKRQGIIKAFGGSNWEHTRIEEVNNYAKEHDLTGFTFAGPHFSYAELLSDPWGASVSIAGEKNRLAREWYYKNDIQILSYSSLARGFLSGKYKTTSDKNIKDVLWWGPIAEYYYPPNIERLKRLEKLAEKKDVTVSMIALSWLLSQELDVFPIVSPSTKEHMEDNINALEIELSSTELEFLDRKI